MHVVPNNSVPINRNLSFVGENSLNMSRIILTSSLCFLLTSVLRSAKEHILGLSRVSSAEKTDKFADDFVFEEAIIAEYALVINGHSLVRCSTASH